MISRPTKPRGILNPGHGENNGEIHTEWNFEHRCELDWLADLLHYIRGHIVQEPLKMEDKNRWKRFDLHLLTRLTRTGLADLHGLELRDVRECVFNSVY